MLFNIFVDGGARGLTKVSIGRVENESLILYGNESVSTIFQGDQVLFSIFYINMLCNCLVI